MNESIIQQNHLSQKCLIIVTENVQEITQTLNEMFAVLWRNGMINVHVLIQTDEIWSLHTFKPYQSDCTSLTHVKITSFTPSHYTESITLPFDELYPQKLKNFNKCPLYVAVREFPPSTIRHKDNGDLGGFEITMIEAIAQSINATLIHNFSSNDRGIIFENGTGTGNLNMVVTGEANFAIGSYQQTKERSKFMVESMPISHASYGFVMKIDTRSTAKNPLSAPFQR